MDWVSRRRPLSFSLALIDNGGCRQGLAAHTPSGAQRGNWPACCMSTPSPLHGFVGRPACSLDRKKLLGHGCQREQCLQGTHSPDPGSLVWAEPHRPLTDLAFWTPFLSFMPHWGGEDFRAVPVIQAGEYPSLLCCPPRGLSGHFTGSLSKLCAVAHDSSAMATQTLM